MEHPHTPHPKIVHFVDRHEVAALVALTTSLVLALVIMSLLGSYL